MGFRENLKSELAYKGMLVKELSVVTGIRKHTLDNYLNTHKALPNAESAVKIAQALGVTVEYLVTGRETGSHRQRPLSTLPQDILSLVDIAGQLSPRKRKLANKLLEVLKEEDNLP